MNERSIFLAALDIPDPAARTAYLDQACGGDQGVRRGVEGLLAAQARSGTFMPAPAEGPTTEDHTPGEGPGSRIGPYKLLQQIGEGGMGVVYMAEQQEPVRRTVALKIIREGMDSRAVLARFEAERQALALMDHPNIARVLDAGTTPTGRPFFVMELVKGVPITRFCDEHQLPLRERLELFVPVCQAIQHAHQKGVIHRDIKPSNVLIALYDDKPVPKVIDFGVAKATSQKLTDKTLFTAFGSVVGTLEYMSPEQAKLNQLDIDTRSDVYGLGVLLYELLTGTTPLDRARLKTAALDEVLRLIREEDPPRPSTRLSTTQTQPSIAAARRIEPAHLGRVLRGELDWIVMKALEKDRTRRYETAIGLARDVERYLKDEAVEACPPTVGYRLRKAYRKNRAAVGVAVAFLLLLSVASVVAAVLALQAWQAERVAVDARSRAEQREAEANEQRAQAERERQRAEREQQRAEEEKRSAQAVRDFLQDDLLGKASMFSQAEALRLTGGDFAVKPNPTVTELIDRAAAQLAPDKIEAKFPGLPYVQAEVLKTVGAAYLEIDQATKALDLLTRAVERYRTARGPDDAATLGARYTLAMAHGHLGRPDEVRRQLEAVRDDRLRLLGPYHRDTFKVQSDLATLNVLGGRPDTAAAALRPLQAAAREHLGPDDVDYLLISGRLGIALLYARRGAEAVRELEAVRDTCRRLKVRRDHPGIQEGLWHLSRAYRAANREGEAVVLLEEVLRDWANAGDPVNPATFAVREQLAWIHFDAGRNEVALELFLRNQSAAANPTSEVHNLNALHFTYSRLGRLEDIVAVARKALDVLAKHYGPDLRDGQTAYFRALAGYTLFQQKKYAEAEPLLVAGSLEMGEHFAQLPILAKGQFPAYNRAVLDLYAVTNRPDEAKMWAGKQIAALERNLQGLLTSSAPVPLIVLQAIATLASAYVDAGRKEDTIRLFEETLARLKADGWPLDESSQRSLGILRQAVRRAGRFDLAAEMSAAIVAAFRKLPDPPKESFTRELMALGEELTLAKRPSEAEPHQREALRIWKGHDPNAWQATVAKWGLARALLRQQKHAEAEPLLLEAYKESVERIERAPPGQKNFPATAANLLIELYKATNKPDEVTKWEAEKAKHGSK